jgi:hypothetical protein
VSYDGFGYVSCVVNQNILNDALDFSKSLWIEHEKSEDQKYKDMLR